MCSSSWHKLLMYQSYFKRLNQIDLGETVYMYINSLPYYMEVLVLFGMSNTLWSNSRASRIDGNQMREIITYYILEQCRKVIYLEEF